MKCTRYGCDLDLIRDQFCPQMLYCPVHGVQEPFPLELATEKKRAVESEFDIFLGWIVRLGQKGMLDYSVSRSMSEDAPAEITIENHGSQEIDVRFKFDQVSGHLIGVKCYTDRRK